MDLPLVLGGLLVGATHVFAGPDHLAVLAPFSIDARRQAWRIGLRWGIGHALGILGVGLVGYAAMDWLDVEIVRGVSHRLLGGVLIAVGTWGILHSRRASFVADRGGTPGGPASGRMHALGTHMHTRAALLVGVVHGMVGTASVLGVLPALAQSSWLHASLYLLSFGTGSILAMVVAATGIGFAAPGPGSSAAGAYRLVFLGTSVACLILGALLLVFSGWKFPFLPSGV